MFRQQRVRVTRQFEGGEQVDLENAAPLFLGVIHRGLGQVAAGVVDQQVEAVGMVFHPVEDLAAVFVVGDIGGHGMDATIGEFVQQFVAHHFQCVRVARDQHHVGAKAEQFAA